MIHSASCLLRLATLFFSAAVAAGARAEEHPVSGGEKSPSVQAIEQALATKVEVRVVEQRLGEVIERIGQEFRINIRVDRSALEEAGASPDTPVTLQVRGISLRSVLDLILAELDLAWVVRDEVLLVTTIERTEDVQEVRVYYVRDLLEYPPSDSYPEPQPDYRSLIGLITIEVEPQSWPEGTGPIAGIEEIRSLGVVVIRQTQHVHEKIAALLASLRQEGSKRPVGAVHDERDPTPYIRVYRLPLLRDYSAPQQTSEGAPGQTIKGGGMFSVPAGSEPRAAADSAGDSASKDAPSGVLAQFGASGFGGGGFRSGGFGGGGQAMDPRPLAEQLAKIIPEIIEPAIWQAAGGEGSIHAFHGKLIVRTTARVHRQIAALLGDLGR